jgi:hypothetical protein
MAAGCHWRYCANIFALQKNAVAKAPQLGAIAHEIITNVCLADVTDIKFVQRAWGNGQGGKDRRQEKSGTEPRTRRIKGRNQRVIEAARRSRRQLGT